MCMRVGRGQAESRGSPHAAEDWGRSHSLPHDSSECNLRYNRAMHTVWSFADQATEAVNWLRAGSSRSVHRSSYLPVSGPMRPPHNASC